MPFGPGLAGMRLNMWHDVMCQALGAGDIVGALLAKE